MLPGDPSVSGCWLLPSAFIVSRSSTAEIECDTRLVAHDPRVMSGWDQVGISGRSLHLGAVFHPEAHPSRDEIAQMLLGAQLTFAGARVVL